MTRFMSLNETFGAALRSSASLAWNASWCSGGTSPTSRKLMTCPSFIAAPFIVPSAATICSAASIWRFSSASLRPSSPRATLAARVPSCRALWPAASRPIFAARATRPAGMSCRWRAIRPPTLPAPCRQPRPQPGGRVPRRGVHDVAVADRGVRPVHDARPVLLQRVHELAGEDRQHGGVARALLDADGRADLEVLRVDARVQRSRDRREVGVAAEDLARRHLAEGVVGDHPEQAALVDEVEQPGGAVAEQRADVERGLRELEAARDHDREAGQRARVLEAARDRDLLAEVRRGGEGDR